MASSNFNITVSETLKPEIEFLRQEIRRLERENNDLQVSLLTITEHGDSIEAELYESNQRLLREIGQRRQAEATLQQILETVSRDKADLELILKTTAEHGDILEYQLYSKAVESMRQNEDLLQAIAESTPVLMFLTRREDGAITYANSTAGEQLGLKIQTLFGRHLCEFYANPKDEESLLQLLAEYGVVKNYEMQVFRADGTDIWVSVSVHPLPLDPGTLLTTFYDITSRKQAEVILKDYTQELERQVEQRTEELRRAEQEYRSIFENACEGIFQATHEGKYLRCNPALAKIYGYNYPEELMAKVSDINKQLYVEPARRKELNLFLKTYNSVNEFESEVYRKDGSIIWISENIRAVKNSAGEVLYYEGSVQDITRRKLAEENLKDSEERFNFAVSGVNDGVWDWEIKKNHVYYSPVWMEILGYAEGELPYEMKTWANNVYPEDLPGALAAFKEHINGKTSMYHNIHRMKHKNGEWVWVEVKGKSILNKNGKPCRVIGTMSDITSRKKVEQALQEAALAAESANRAKSEFLASMSHELRTPLNAILGFSQMMSRNSSLGAEEQNDLGIINRAGEHLLGLIDDILEFSKIEACKITLNESQFYLKELLDNLQKTLQLRADNKGLNLFFEYAPDLPAYVQTDERKLRQVLLNILANAIKFTEKGLVTLRVKQQRLLVENRQTLIFEIEDTGPGIAPEEIHLLFEAFSQTASGRKSGQGTGLGLPISQKYVRLMGGNITVSSAPGKGTVFCFDIPISLGNAAEVESTQPQRKVIALVAGQCEQRILVVDDVFDSRHLLMKLLRSIGFSVREAENGKEAIKVCKSWQPHLILMDMGMPEMDGYEATKHIKNDKNRNVETKIFALTSSVFEEQRQKIIAAGCDAFISKPFQIEVLLEKIREHLGIKYEYKQKNEVTKSQNKEDGKNISEADLLKLLSQMSADWIQKLYEAASECYEDNLLNLLKKIPPEQTILATALTNLVEEFEFQKILKLVQKTIDQRSNDSFYF